MPNIATALREEITRLARKELKKENSLLRKSSAQHRRDIAALKRQVVSLLKSIGQLRKNVQTKTVKTEEVAEDSTIRFSSKGLVSQRERLGLSAADYAKLAGVSGLSIYNWEKGKAKPRKEQVATLAKLRGIGKKEATARLKKLSKKR